ncbi:DUF3489 domain-containing protein [Sphingopyxis sp. J-6]|uniref:DUF3489 domain-containing protein n=1 Tax=Sphingopyxis sp. J-6 TaxID=3122054 RepID=UPI0039842BDB
MTDQTTAVEPIARAQTKAAAVQKMLSRAKGATLAEITADTNWQPHSARAFLTGLRKKGMNIVRECRPNGDTSWRIER